MEFKYDVFISYSHKDSLFVETLAKKLSGYLPPKSITAERKRLSVFRDKDEAKGNRLSKEIEDALRQSKKLIVVCSPDGASSKWVHKEIAAFSETRSVEDIIPILSKGEPSTSISPLLVELFKGEPWAPDFRSDGTEKPKLPDKSWYHLIACIYGVDRSIVEAREKKRKRRQIAGLSVAGSIVLVGLFFLVWQWQQTSKRQLEKESVQLAYQANSSADVSDALNLALAALEKSETDDAQMALDSALRKMFKNLKDREAEHFAFRFQSVYAMDTVSGRIFISSSLGSSILYNFKSGSKKIFTTENLVPFVKAAFSNNGKLLATVDAHKVLDIWNIEGNVSKKLSYNIEKEGDIAFVDVVFSGDDRHILIHPYKTNMTIRGVEDTLFVNHLNTGSHFQTSTVLNTDKTLIAIKADTTCVVSFNNAKVIWPKKGSEEKKYVFIGFSNKGNMFLLQPRDTKLYSAWDDKPQIQPSDSLVLVKLNDKLEVTETLAKKAEEFDHIFILTNFNVEDVNEYTGKLLMKKNPGGAINEDYNRIKVWPKDNILIANPMLSENPIVFSFDSLRLIETLSFPHFVFDSWFADEVYLVNNRIFINGWFEDSTKAQNQPTFNIYDNKFNVYDTARVGNQVGRDYKMVVYSLTQKKVLNTYSSGSDIHFAQSNASFVSLYKCDTAGKEGCEFISFFDANTGKQYNKIPYTKEYSRFSVGVLYLSYSGDQVVIETGNEFIFCNNSQNNPRRINLYNEDAKGLAADQKAVAEEAPLQARINIAKKWLSKM